jgi:hypothetical protein
MEKQNEKDILWALGKKERPRIRVNLSSGGVESVLVGNQPFSKEQVDNGLQKIYGQLPKDPIGYIDALKIAGAGAYESRISREKLRQTIHDYVV